MGNEMKNRTILSWVLVCFGFISAVTGIVLALTCYRNSPAMLKQPEEAKNTVNSFFHAVCDSDFDTAAQMIQGTPDLGVVGDSSDPVGVIIWNAYWDSARFEMVGDCYATDTGVVQNVSFTRLDVSCVSEHLRERSMEILQQRVAQAADPSEIYNEKNEYREDLVMSILEEAAQQILDEEAELVTTQLAVNLCYEDGQWRIAADKDLIDQIFFGCLF